jgi:hypothetical protein
MSQRFSQRQLRLNFMGNMQLPDMSPATRASEMPIAGKDGTYVLFPAGRTISDDAPASWGVL